MTNKESNSCYQYQQLFFHTKLTLITTTIRLCLIISLFLNENILQWIHSTILKSVLINSIFTIDHINEANAVRHMMPTSSIDLIEDGSFADAYRENQIHLPPLLLALLEYLYFLLPKSERTYNLIIRIALTFIDLLIAYKLELMCIQIFQLENKYSNESTLQEKMSKCIYPELSHIFQITDQSDQSIKTTEKSDQPIQINEEQPNQSIPTTEPSDLSINKNIIEEIENEPIFYRKDIPLFIAQLYYMSPITILASSGIGSFQNIKVLLLFYALVEALIENGSIVWTAFWLSLSSYIDIHFILFLIPSIFIFQKKTQKYDVIKSSKSSLLLILFFIIFYFVLHLLSYLLLGGTHLDYFTIFCSTHGYSFQLHTFEPSLSIVWYLSMELFGRFRLYFTILLGGIPYILIAPITIRLYEYPAVLIAIFWMLGVIFRPPGTLFDFNIGLCLMMCSPRSLARMPRIVSLVSLLAIPIPVCLYLVTYRMWLGPNTAEANFPYFQCLAYNIFIAIIMLTFSSASLVRDKALRVTEKNLQNETYVSEKKL